MNFKAPISTTREQSERLLALGVKPKTADCYIECAPSGKDFTYIRQPYNEDIFRRSNIIPSWSLTRLLEMIPTEIENDYCSAVLQITNPVIQYWCFSEEESYVLFNRTDIFNNAVECIGWLIRNDYFKKEYMINK